MSGAWVARRTGGSAGSPWGRVPGTVLRAAGRSGLGGRKREPANDHGPASPPARQPRQLRVRGGLRRAAVVMARELLKPPGQGGAGDLVIVGELPPVSGVLSSRTHGPSGPGPGRRLFSCPRSPAVPLPGCVTSGESLALSEPQALSFNLETGGCQTPTRCDPVVSTAWRRLSGGQGGVELRPLPTVGANRPGAAADPGPAHGSGPRPGTCGHPPPLAETLPGCGERRATAAAPRGV